MIFTQKCNGIFTANHCDDGQRGVSWPPLEPRLRTTENREYLDKGSATNCTKSNGLIQTPSKQLNYDKYWQKNYFNT